MKIVPLLIFLSCSVAQAQDRNPEVRIHRLEARLRASRETINILKKELRFLEESLQSCWSVPADKCEIPPDYIIVHTHDKEAAGSPPRILCPNR